MQIDLDQIYENLDKMTEMKRYKPPTPGYFPTLAEINTYANSEDFEHMLPYLLWLDDCLTGADREPHKEATEALRRIVDRIMDEQEQEEQGWEGEE